MANITSITDFKNPYIPYAVSGENTEEYLNEIIEYYEKIILTNILGEIEYNDYIANPTNTEWVNFVSGTTYTYNSVSYVYPGIKDVLVKLIYYYWQKDTASNLGESGQLKKTLVHATQIIPSGKMARAYNEAVDLIINNRSYSPTVYNYLLHQQSLNDYFPDWSYTHRYKINQFSI
jgi:hypothetical protein